MQAGVANIPFFGAVAKAFQFFFIQRAGTTDPAVSGSPGQHGHVQAIQERAADPRSSPLAPDPLPQGDKLSRSICLDDAARIVGAKSLRGFALPASEGWIEDHCEAAHAEPSKNNHFSKASVWVALALSSSFYDAVFFDRSFGMRCDGHVAVN